MATITSAQSGLASATSTWVGGVVPVEGDKVIIAAGHVVTLDGTFTWGDNSVTTTIPNAAINVSGTLKASRLVNSSLTCKGLLLTNMGSSLDFGTDADPIPATVTAALILNKATTPANRTGLQQVTPTSGAGNHISWSFFGDDARQRGVNLEADATTGSSTIRLISAAHGWSVGDELLFMNTTNNSSADECELRTVSSIGADPKDITLNAAPTYLHKAGSPVCNLSSNVTIRPYNEVSGQGVTCSVNFPSTTGGATLGYYVKFNNVRFQNIGHAGINSGFTYAGGTSISDLGVTVEKCAWKNTVPGLVGSLINSGITRPTVVDQLVFYSTTGSNVAFSTQGLQVANSWVATSGAVSSTATALQSVSDSWIVAIGNAGPIGNTGGRYTRCTISGRANAIIPVGIFDVQLDSCDVGYTYGWKAINGDNIYRFAGQVYSVNTSKFVNCLMNAGALSIPASAETMAAQRFVGVEFVNKNASVASQEIYSAAGSVKRDNSEKRRSASSIAMAHHATGMDVEREQQILCAAGSSIRVVGYVKADTAFYNGGGSNWTPPTVTISGNGIAPVTFTASSAANNAWEQFDLSATNSSGIDGNFTLTYTANAKIVTTGTVWFDGVPDAPFVTKCRHYGFLFDESSPVRTIDPYTVASEATAAAYTGATINGGTKRITFGAGTADTAQKFYDYSRAWCCLNLAQQVPFTRAGALFALAAGWTVAEPTYGGVTWGGGNIEFNTVGSKSGAFDSCDFTFTTAGAYTFSGATFGGTIELINTSGGSITVELPPGTSYTNTGPNITVTEPTVARGLDFNGVLPGSTVKVFATGTQTVIATPTGPGWSWTEGTPGSVTVDYTIQRVGYLPIRVTGVTVTAAISGGVQTVPVQQIEAPAYVASSGLTFGANCFANPATKRFGLTAASTLQNYYSRMMESWIVEATLQNKPFPMVANGPNSFAFTDDWEWDLATYPASIANLSRDGMKYKNAAGAVTAMWAAILTAGVPAGLQVRYQQSDGGLLGAAANTGNMDELLQIYGDATHGNFDRTDWLVLKVQAEGFDQAEAVHFDIYDQLDDQLYVYGLSPIPNGVAAGVDVPGIAVTSEVAPVEWPAASGKFFSTTIIDTAAPHSGLEIMQAIRARNDFDMHDMIRPHGAKFKTVTGNLYGDYLITPAGVRVVMNDGVTPHPDFDLFSDDTGGNPYVPPVIAQITWAGALNATTVLLYNDSDAGTIIDTQVVSGAGGYVWSITLPHAAVAVGDSLRLRFGNKAYYAGELQGTMTATGLAFVGSMTLHPVYAGWGLNGSAYDQANGGPYTMDGLNLEIDIGGGAGTGSKKELAAWTQHLMTLPAGLDAFYGAWDLLDLNLIRQNVSIANVLIDKPTAGQFVFMDNDVNYYRSDFSIPYNTTHSTIFMTYNAKPFIATVAGSNVITGDISTVLAAIPAASENATAVRTEIATELARIDAPISTRLPTAAYTAPDNAGIADIDAKTDSLAAIQAKTDQLTFTSGKVQSDMRMAVGQSLKGDGSESDKIRSTLVP